VVLVEDAAEDASPLYGFVDLHDHVRVVVGWALIAAVMWTVAVVATRKSHVVSELVKEVRRMSKA
jgi:hypothetical protein